MSAATIFPKCPCAADLLSLSLLTIFSFSPFRKKLFAYQLLPSGMSFLSSQLGNLFSLQPFLSLDFLGQILALLMFHFLGTGFLRRYRIFPVLSILPSRSHLFIGAFLS